MAYVTVPKDLTHVKSTVVFGLTNRQLICFSGALVIGVPLYFLTRGALSNSCLLYTSHPKAMSIYKGRPLKPLHCLFPP